MKDLNIFNHIFLYTRYTDDSTFFIKNINSATEIIKTFDCFSLFFVKINKAKCEIARIGTLKGVNWHSKLWNVLISIILSFKYLEYVTLMTKKLKIKRTFSIILESFRMF